MKKNIVEKLQKNNVEKCSQNFFITQYVTNIILVWLVMSKIRLKTFGLKQAYQPSFRFKAKKKNLGWLKNQYRFCTFLIIDFWNFIYFNYKFIKFEIAVSDATTEK